MANIKAMAAAKKLLIAGPFDDAADRPDAIGELLSHDPAIAAGRLAAELHLWYGPVGLTYNGAGHEELPH
ncbi:MAG: hypothetical protein ABI678_00300 [Kofleriaceae bacterium]